MLTGYFKQPPLLASMNKIRICFFVSIISLHVAGNPYSNAYSILSHQALIDQSWEKSIKPLLKLKYPASTEEELKKARAYAYGGAIAPDMGYFPFGNVFYTDLVHYVRSGDFVNALLDEADSLNEYAFALGFLCHYNADRYGHFLAINRCVALTYPKMERKYGDVVTYAEDHISHKRIEFSFDVLQTAKGSYASQAYHNFIGFQVSRPVLERAFLTTYGLDLNRVFADLSLAIESFRLSVKNLFHDQEFGKTGKKPGIFANFLALVIRISPKIGPLRVFKFKEPGPAGEKLFVQSFDTALFHYSATVKLLGSEKINLNNVDYDTGNLTRPGEYPLTDKNYGILIRKLRKNNFEHLNEDLKQNILDFYRDNTTLSIVYKNSRKKKKVKEALVEIKVAKANQSN